MKEFTPPPEGEEEDEDDDSEYTDDDEDDDDDYSDEEDEETDEDGSRIPKYKDEFLEMVSNTQCWNIFKLMKNIFYAHN